MVAVIKKAGRNPPSRWKVCGKGKNVETWKKLVKYPSLGFAQGVTARDIPQNAALSILVAEDNAINQKVAVLLLKQFGYQADVAGNGQEAVEAFDKHPYDLIFMDRDMPVMDGMDATRELRRLHPAEKQPCIIALTAASTDEEMRECIDSGMNGILQKPVIPNKLLEAIGQALAFIRERDHKKV